MGNLTKKEKWYAYALGFLLGCLFVWPIYEHRQVTARQKKGPLPTLGAPTVPQRPAP